jgi:lactoylglutathione lyase
MSDTSATKPLDPRLWVWGANDTHRRFLHTMIRVRDVDASLAFYVDLLGMKKLGEPFDVPSRRTTGLFIGFDSYAAGGCLELVRAWDAQGPYTHGTGYGHISIGVPDMDELVARLDAAGVEFTLRPAPLLAGGPKVAFIKDPDGYAIELIQTQAQTG